MHAYNHATKQLKVRDLISFMNILSFVLVPFLVLTIKKRDGVLRTRGKVKKRLFLYIYFN
jgi:hypothetical protein